MTRLPFDDQATDFDRRAGFPAGTPRTIADALIRLATWTNGLMLELAAGTGEIGSDIARSPRPYLGLDLSCSMLARFRRKLPPSSPGHLLVQADADYPWPVADAVAGVIFCSRAAHLLGFDQLINEVLRVAHPDGALLVLGSVQRQAGSLRDALRREMRQILASHGVEGRGGRKARRYILATFAERGGEILDPRRVATWPVTERAADSLAAWRKKSGLAGHGVAPEIRLDVLNRLESWARERYTELHAEHKSSESYMLEAVRFRPS